MPLSNAQSGFLEQWKSLGAQDAHGKTLAQNPSECVIMAANGRNGWEYRHVSDRQTRVVGGELTGLIRDFVPEDTVSIASAQNAKVVATQRPFKFGWPGSIKGAVGMWAERIVVPVAAAGGSSAAIVSHYSWSDEIPPHIRFCLASILETVSSDAHATEQRLVTAIQSRASYQVISQYLDDIRVKTVPEQSTKLTLMQLALFDVTYSQEELF